MGNEMLQQPPSEFRPKVLIVDDTPANLLAFGLVLEHDGYELFQANSGHEALKKSLQHDFAVILLDVRMPVLDGLETAAALRGGRARHTPIIFISAHDKTPKEVEQGYLAGALDYLFSPVDPDTLRRKVSAFVDFYAANRELKRKCEVQTRTIEALQNEIKTLKQGITSREASISEHA